MRGRPPPALLSALGAVAIGLHANVGTAATPAAANLVCSGQYADDFSALSVAARDFDHRPEATFSYCTRNTATYECLSYGSDGAVRHERRRVVLHGTAFAYRKQGGDTLLVTNDHVAAWPAVTDGAHTVEGVPAGCKRVSEALALVDGEHDTFAGDDVAVTRVVTDPGLDVAVLKAHGDLQVMPWKIGRSAGIRERNLVEVRGFPLGAFRATNIGKIVSAHDHDDFGDWDHDDFIVDALLSRGNSGSPVLAISCATGEYELVGVYHAGYSEGSALNAVIGIDQIRELMSTLKRSAHERDDGAVVVDGDARRRIAGELADGGDTFFPVGAQVAMARLTPGGALLYALYPRDFPTTDQPALVLEDLAASEPAAFGALGHVWLGSARGLKRYDLAFFDAEAQANLKRALGALRSDLAARLDYRTAAAGRQSRQAESALRQAGKQLARAAAARADVLQAIADLAERFAPSGEERGRRLAGLSRAEGEPAAKTPTVAAPKPGSATASVTPVTPGPETLASHRAP
jgi:serine protease Do